MSLNHKETCGCLDCRLLRLERKVERIMSDQEAVLSQITAIQTEVAQKFAAFGVLVTDLETAINNAPNNGFPAQEDPAVIAALATLKSAVDAVTVPADPTLTGAGSTSPTGGTAPATSSESATSSGAGGTEPSGATPSSPSGTPTPEATSAESVSGQIGNTSL